MGQFEVSIEVQFVKMHKITVLILFLVGCFIQGESGRIPLSSLASLGNLGRYGGVAQQGVQRSLNGMRQRVRHTGIGRGVRKMRGNVGSKLN